MFNNKDFLVKKCFDRGEQYVFKFPNGYGASVIRGPYSYGGDRGFFELAVLGKDGELNYSTPITDDVVGYLDEKDVEDRLTMVKAL